MLLEKGQTVASSGGQDTKAPAKKDRNTTTALAGAGQVPTISGTKGHQSVVAAAAEKQTTKDQVAAKQQEASPKSQQGRSATLKPGVQGRATPRAGV